MTFTRLVIISALLHGAALFAFGSHRSVSKPPQAATDLWVVDISTLLVSEVPGDTPAPPEPPKLKAEAVAPPAMEEPISETAAKKEITDQQHVTPANLTQLPAATAATTPDSRAVSLTAAFRNTMNNQSIVTFMYAYHRASTKAVTGMVSGSLSGDVRRALDGARGTVVVSFRDGAVAGLDILTENEELRGLLTGVQWDAVPSPKNYHLPISRMAYTISLSHGKVGVTASLL